MILSHFVEKLKVGKRFVLLDMVVHPDCEPQWETAGPANKFIPVDVWRLIYRKLEDLCRRQFGEGIRAKDSDGRCEIDKEYTFRLAEKVNYLLKYEFKDSNCRTLLNTLYNEKDTRLHKECLVVQVIDETKDLFRQLEERKKTIEKLQKENEKLKELPEPSQEYTPSPVKSSSVSAMASMEYIPIAINGGSPMGSPSYRARKISSSVKMEPDPYTPISSQETNPDKVAYVPSSLKQTPPSRADVELKVEASNSDESIIAGKRRRRHKEIFGNSDEEDDGKRTPKPEPEDAHNVSEENMFSQDSSPPPIDIIGSEATADPKRLQLPRKTKSAVSYGSLLSPPSGSDGTPPPPSTTKRRRKDEDSKRSSSKKDSSKIPSRGTIDGWMKKSSRTDGESTSSASCSSKDPHSKGKENEKRSNSRKPKKEPTPTPPALVVDREKLKEEEEIMRKTIAGLDQLDKMLPEDKTELDVPVLDCLKLTIPDINATFETYRRELRQIFDRYKNKSEREWQQAEELCYFTEVTSVMSDDQTYAMMKRLEEEFVPEDQRGMYTEFFSSTLIMEWGLRIWMRMFKFHDRQEALDRIRLQEEANPMELTPSCLNSLTVSRSRKR